MAEKSERRADVVPLKRRKCPVCGQPALTNHRPFCSGRCADIDLGRWLNGNYRIPTDETPGDAPGDTAEAADGALGDDDGRG